MEPFLLLTAKESAFQKKKKNPLSSWDLLIVEAAWAPGKNIFRLIWSETDRLFKAHWLMLLEEHGT